jgi:cytidine deaminase
LSKEKKTLVDHARAARELSVSPYSRFLIGAAVKTRAGKIFTGCNIESSSYGLTVCAERVAIYKAVSEGEREFESIAIVADTEPLTPPCGACRQVIWDLCGDIDVLLANLNGDKEQIKMRRLYSHAFDERFLIEPHRK